MDANGSRFHLLFGASDWGSCLQDGVALAARWGARDTATTVQFDAQTQELTLAPRTFRFVAARADVAPALGRRRGSGADRFGNLYWIDDDTKRIQVVSAGTGTVSEFWSGSAEATLPQHGDFADTTVATLAATQLRGLAVTEDHFLVVGTVQPAGVLIFDLYASGPPTAMVWPAAIAFTPFDMAARPGGGVWILDRDHLRYWGLDRRFRVISCEQSSGLVQPATVDDFQPVDGAPARGLPEQRFPEGLVYQALSDVTAVDAIAIEALPDGSVLILDRDPTQAFSRVLRYRLGTRLGEPQSLDFVAAQMEQTLAAPFTLTAHDFIYLPASSTDVEQLIIAGADGNQCEAVALSYSGDTFSLQALSRYRYLPMRRFVGKGLLLALGQVYYDFADTWIPLTEQCRPRFLGRGQIETRAEGFDSGEPDCIWHRLLVDASIPGDTQVEVYSRAANTPADLAAAPWMAEPGFYRRGDGSELPWMLPMLPAAQLAARGDSQGCHELLFQRAEGRFLQLRLVLTGNERATPRVQALRIWYPRFSYARQYLPGVYREERSSGVFLERMLANIEGLYTTLEDKIASVRALFHWQSAPAEALDWLAGWLDAVLDPAWDETRQRLFIKHAVNFFQYRGTTHGVRMALALALDPQVCDLVLGEPGAVSEAGQTYRIIERFRTRTTPGLVFGDVSGAVGPREVPATARWAPAEGAARLTQRYRDFLQAAGVAAEEAGKAVFTLFPPPAVAGQASPTAAFWQPFAEQILGFVPTVADERRRWQQYLTGEYAGSISDYQADWGASATSFAEVNLPTDFPAADRPQAQWLEFVGLPLVPGTGQERQLWQAFLSRRYGHIAALNSRYRTQWPSFETVPLFDRIPADGSGPTDWYQFESVVKVMQAHAHRFSVLVPSAGPNADVVQVQDRLSLARRVIEMVKPAHTVFDVGFYWALFQIGNARLGYDTRVDLGGRSPELMPTLSLGRDFIGASHLALSIVRQQDQRMSLDGLPLAT